MISGRRLRGIVLALTIAIVPVTAPAADIEWQPCGDTTTAGSAAAIDCGWLATGDALAGRTVRLRVAILRARPDRHDDAPVVYVPGGPGAAAGVDAASLKRWRAWQQRAAWPHDIVLFDPRGTGESRPRPGCETNDEKNRRAVTSNRQDFVDAARAARRCYDNLGANLAAQLGPAAQLRDLQALLDALGVTKANFWGVSYGTRIVRLFAARHPDRVRAMVLDSLFAFDQDDLLVLPAQIGAAIAQLDANCANSTDCMTRGRPPGAIVRDLLAQYAEQPPTVVLGRNGPTPRRFVVTPYRLLLMLLFASYDPDAAADTAARLTRARNGDTGALAPLADRVWRYTIEERRSEAVFWSTRCAFGDVVADAAAWRHALSAHPAIARYLEPARASAVCDFWQVPRVSPPAAGGPIGMPTLVIAGGADALTPAAWARAFVEANPRVRLLHVPAAGHGVGFTSACALRAMGRFWNQPRLPTLPDCG